MRTGPNKRTANELKDQLVQAHRNYKEVKKNLVEESITSLEAKTSPWLIVLLVGLIALGWLTVTFFPFLVERFYDRFGFHLIYIIFFVSYFAFFVVSKVIVKPSMEELSDDTSYIALFSACPDRSLRGWLAAMFGALHTVALAAYGVFRLTDGQH